MVRMSSLSSNKGFRSLKSMAVYWNICMLWSSMLCDVLFNSYELEINYSFKKNTYIYKGEMHFSGLESAGFLNFCLS